VYPSGAQFDDCLRDGIAPKLVSIGSCFAEEFAHHMRHNDSGT